MLGNLLDVKLFCDIPASSLWLLKRSVCVEGRGRCCCDCVAFFLSGSVFDPSDTQIVFTEWAGKGGKRETRGRKMCCEGGRFVDVRGNSYRRGNEILHD